MLKQAIISMRPEQWYKNLIVFFGITFSLNLSDLGMWSQVTLAFIIFCLVSGGEYLINDILDIKRDQNHPTKKNRPIPSGKLTIRSALSSAIILFTISLSTSVFINLEFLVILALYLLLTLLYSLLLKRFPVIDLIVISTGFVIRAIAGCLAIDVVFSPWLIACTFLLALFLALGKRRHELVFLGDKAVLHRESLRGFSLARMDLLTYSVAGALIAAYLAYCIFTVPAIVMLTLPVAIYGLLRYLILIRKSSEADVTDVIFKDINLAICIALWTIIIIFTLYI